MKFGVLSHKSELINASYSTILRLTKEHEIHFYEIKQGQHYGS